MRLIIRTAIKAKILEVEKLNVAVDCKEIKEYRSDGDVTEID